MGVAWNSVQQVANVVAVAACASNMMRSHCGGRGRLPHCLMAPPVLCITFVNGSHVAHVCHLITSTQLKSMTIAMTS